MVVSCVLRTAELCRPTYFIQNLWKTFSRKQSCIRPNVQYPACNKQGFGSGIFPNPGSGGLYPKRRDIFKRLWNEFFRYYQKTPFLFLYFWCQMSPVSARAPDPDPGKNSDRIRITRVTRPGYPTASNLISGQSLKKRITYYINCQKKNSESVTWCLVLNISTKILLSWI